MTSFLQVSFNFHEHLTSRLNSVCTVDAHTAHHLYTECLKGDLMRNRTIILVSHHVQLVAPGADYIVALENGRVQYSGDRDAFVGSKIMSTLIQSQAAEAEAEAGEAEAAPAEDAAEKVMEKTDAASASTAAGAGAVTGPAKVKKPARKLVEEEKRAVGRVDREIWRTYVWACGGWPYWIIFGLSLLVATVVPVVENSWLRWVLLV
jgi:ABC-type glutathione transport system ATPase component